MYVHRVYTHTHCLAAYYYYYFIFMQYTILFCVLFMLMCHCMCIIHYHDNYSGSWIWKINTIYWLTCLNNNFVPNTFINSNPFPFGLHSRAHPIFVDNLVYTCWYTNFDISAMFILTPIALYIRAFNFMFVLKGCRYFICSFRRQYL
jgi:hypothetical protein